MDIDQCLDKVGGYRRYSLAAFFVIGGTVCFTWACQGLIFVFIGWTPQHHCTIPTGGLANESIPIDEETKGLHKCKMYAENSTNVTTHCDHGWTYENMEGKSTIVNEWDLVCDRSFLPEMSLMIFGVGEIFGEIAGNVIADKLGRKWVHITGFALIAVSGSVTAVSQNYNTYVILVLFSSLANAACMSAAYMHLLELFDSKRRTLIGMAFDYLWVAGYLYVGVMGYLVRDWRHLQLALSLTSVLGLLSVLFPESPVWLLANHKYEQAEAALRQMARWNGVQVEGPLLAQETEMTENHSKEDKQVGSIEDGMKDAVQSDHSTKAPPEETGQETILDLFRWPLILKYTVISSLLWFSITNAYYFIILVTPSLAGDFYVSFFLSCIVEIPAYTVTIVVVRYSRRIPSVVFLILAGISLCSLAFVQNWAPVTPAIMFLALFGKFSVTASFAVVTFYTRELFPTNLRGTSFAVSNFLGRMGMVLAPLASYKAKTVPWLPNLVLGVISLVVGIISLLLPETKNWPSLPMSIADVYRFSRGEFNSTNREKEDEKA